MLVLLELLSGICVGAVKDAVVDDVPAPCASATQEVAVMVAPTAVLIEELPLSETPVGAEISALALEAPAAEPAREVAAATLAEVLDTAAAPLVCT